MAVPIWKIDGVAIPRNPNDYSVKYDKVNATYEPLADGNVVRVASARVIAGADFVLSWDKADARLVNFLMQFFNPKYPTSNMLHKITMDGMQPPKQAVVYFDTPQKAMSKDTLVTKLGEGGTRHDLSLTVRMVSPFLQSLNLIPSATPTAANVKLWFGGPIGNAFDNLPTWNGNGWNQPVVNGANNFSFSNLGTAPWNPIIRINGPFTTLSISFPQDMDGTGSGTQFVWTGTAVATGNYVLFDTLMKRCTLVVGGAANRVYTMKFITVADNNPFAFVPGFDVGTTAVVVNATGTGGATSLDLSNNGTESFRYC